MTQVINLFAAPGVGKSTLSAGLFYKLKHAGINVEMSREYAKDLVWSDRLRAMDDQIHIFGEQHHRLFMLQKDVDVVITDAPILMQLMYSQGYPSCFADTVKWAFDKFNNNNYLLTRTKAYNPKGRRQTLEESDAKQVALVDILAKYDIQYKVTTGNECGLNFIYDDIINKIDR